MLGTEVDQICSQVCAVPGYAHPGRHPCAPHRRAPWHCASCRSGPKRLRAFALHTPRRVRPCGPRSAPLWSSLRSGPHYATLRSSGRATPSRVPRSALRPDLRDAPPWLTCGSPRLRLAVPSARASCKTGPPSVAALGTVPGSSGARPCATRGPSLGARPPSLAASPDRRRIRVLLRFALRLLLLVHPCHCVPGALLYHLLHLFRCSRASRFRIWLRSFRSSGVVFWETRIAMACRVILQTRPRSDLSGFAPGAKRRTRAGRCPVHGRGRALPGAGGRPPWRVRP